MRVVILFAFLAFSTSLSIQGQEFDSSFLESLPETVRQDLLDQVTDKRELEDEQYRRPSTFVQKPVDDSGELLSNRFGVNIFDMMQTTLMPLNEPNFDSSYVLDFGDVLEVQTLGQRGFVTQVEIKRDGSVSIPQIGKLYVAGLSLEDATKKIQQKIGETSIGVESFVTLVNVRDIQVIVAGNVFNPGPYILNGNSNVFHALTISGGPSDMGSFREIELVRDNKVIEVIDLYDTFIFGKSSFNKRLRSGDIVFVKPVQNIVSVIGGVKRPFVYELKETESLDTVISFANGLSADADISDINLYRLIDGKVEDIDVEGIEALKAFSPVDNDRLVIRRFSFRSVEILGAVNNPGSYIVNEGEGLLDLIPRAGGYSRNAYPFGGVLENLNTEKINQMAADELYKSFLDNLSNLSGKASSGSAVEGAASTRLIMEELKNSPVSGRVSAEFDLSVLEVDPSKDVVLQDGDKIMIPEFVNQVYIFGEVSSEGTVRFESDQPVSFYIEKKGGFSSFADERNVFVLNPNGETFKVSKNVFMRQGRDIDIYPGSVIFVPRGLNDGFLITETAQAYASILGNIGVSLASISVLKD
jgi:protein involved in polysaccharide export with SLBB domain